MNKSLFLALIGGVMAFAPAPPLTPHISLLSPTPMMSGYTNSGYNHKVAPFGAPDMDISDASVTMALAGGDLELEIDMYIYHAGEIVVLYSLEDDGADVAPVMELASKDTPVPHTNLIYRMESPCTPSKDGCVKGRKGGQIFKIMVPLPDIEGPLTLVVRQVMTDRMVVQGDGSVRLDSVYYHQAAKLHLVKG